jgi:hypothetical protein
MGYDPANKVTLIVWTNLTVSLDGLPTANTLMVKLLDQIYVTSPLGRKETLAASAKRTAGPAKRLCENSL